MQIPSWIDDIQVIGWDLDGTLYPPDAVSSDMIFSKEIEAVAKQRGWDLVASEAEFRRMYEQLGSHTKTLTAMGVDGPTFFVDLWDKLDLSSFIESDPKIVGMFAKLSDKKHFILSNSNTEAQIRKKLALIGVDENVFDFLVSTTALGAVKPDPKPFLLALEKLNQAGGPPVGTTAQSSVGGGVELLPSNILYVGDRVKTDIRGAVGVGMHNCLVWSESSEAEVCLPSVYEVPGLFGK